MRKTDTQNLDDIMQCRTIVKAKVNNQRKPEKLGNLHRYNIYFQDDNFLQLFFYSDKKDDVEIEENFCPESFFKHPDASCILYDDEKCDGEEGMKQMVNGDIVTNIEATFGFDIESVSIRKGCKLTVHAGKYKHKILQFIMI